MLKSIMGRSGVKKLGEGGVGCVVKPPPFLCEPIKDGVSPKKNTNMVQKAASSVDVDNELRNNAMIDSLDGEFHHHVKILGTCKPDGSNVTSLKSKCNVLSKLEAGTDISVITQEFGGTILTELRIDEINAVFLRKFIDTFEFIVTKMNSLKICHGDLKNDNLVWDGKYVRMIDLGSMFMADIASGTIQRYWPIEMRLVFHDKKGISNHTGGVTKLLSEAIDRNERVERVFEGNNQNVVLQNVVLNAVDNVKEIIKSGPGPISDLFLPSGWRETESARGYTAEYLNPIFLDQYNTLLDLIRKSARIIILDDSDLDRLKKWCSKIDDMMIYIRSALGKVPSDMDWDQIQKTIYGNVDIYCMSTIMVNLIVKCSSLSNDQKRECIWALFENGLNPNTFERDGVNLCTTLRSKIPLDIPVTKPGRFSFSQNRVMPVFNGGRSKTRKRRIIRRTAKKRKRTNKLLSRA